MKRPHGEVWEDLLFPLPVKSGCVTLQHTHVFNNREAPPSVRAQSFYWGFTVGRTS